MCVFDAQLLVAPSNIIRTVHLGLGLARSFAGLHAGGLAFPARCTGDKARCRRQQEGAATRQCGTTYWEGKPLIVQQGRAPVRPSFYLRTTVAGGPQSYRAVVCVLIRTRVLRWSMELLQYCNRESAGQQRAA